MKLLRNSFLISLFLLTIYECACRLIYPKLAFQSGENQWIGNYIKAQSYIYDHSDAQVVIVGSSLSARLSAVLLPSRVFNLSFGGLSALEGMNVVLNASTLPQTIYIETNALGRDFSEYFGNQVLNPIRRRMISLRFAARPLILAQSYLRSRVGQAWRMIGNTGTSGEAPATIIPKEDAQLLSVQKRAYQNSLSSEAQAKLIARLRADITFFDRHGVKVIFFEMPIHSELCDAPRQVSIRHLLLTEFRTRPYIRITDCGTVTTTDGIHLSGANAEQVTRQFAKIIEREMESASEEAEVHLARNQAAAAK
jgi:hypothetical protein